MRRPLTIIAAVLLLAALLTPVIGCGKSGISRDQYNQVQKGMTLDQVEGILGQPDRTHRTGSAQNPNVIWYYNKTEGEGLVRIAFLDGKMDTVSPYEISVNPDE
jgi:hypothetical protein